MSAIGLSTGIPVVTVPQQGPILARPRKEGVYDTEGYVGGSVTPGKITVFRDSTRFVNANSTLALTKKAPRDTNMDAQVGLAKGQHLHWYYMKSKLRALTQNKFTAAFVASIDQIRQIREVAWLSFYFGTTGKGLLFSTQLWQIPEGVGVPMGFTTYNNLSMVASSQAELARDNVFDVTMNGVPVDITEEEVFTTDIETSGQTVTPTSDVYCTLVCGGYFLRGIQ